MKKEHFKRIGQAAIASGGMYVVVIVTSVLFFTYGGAFGPFNDLMAIIQFALLLPVVYGLHTVVDKQPTTINSAISLLGAVSVSAIVVLQAALMLKVLPFEAQFPAVLSAGILMGIWIIGISEYAYKKKVFSKAIKLLGLLAGVGYILTGIGFFLGDQNHPLVAIGFLSSLIGYVAWCFGVGKLFLKKGEKTLP